MRSPVTVYRDNNRIKAKKEQVEEDKEILFKIISTINPEKTDIKFEIINNQANLDENNLISKNSSWFLIKPSKIGKKMNKYKLSSGDIIKIGRISLRIRDIHFSQNNDKNEINNNNDNNINDIKDMNTLRTEANNNISTRNYTSRKIDRLYNTKTREKEYKIKQISLTKNILEKIEKKNKVCRICYVEEDDPENNPLLHPCLCSGSMKYIHLSCLKHWISTRSCEKIDTTKYCIVYIIKPVECELCKTKFPDLIKHNGVFHHLLDFSKDFESYLTLESLTLDKYKNKFIYTISLMNEEETKKKKKLKLGRGHDCDILMSDISVSRVHCYLVPENINKSLYIEDNDSKFGTLILIQSQLIKIEELLPLNIQIGRTYIECKVKKPFKLFECCNVEEYSNIFYYFNQNAKKVNGHVNLVIKYDENDNEDNNNNLINENEDYKGNKTCEQKYPNKINGEYSYGQIEHISVNKDKISDNEYFRMRHKKENNLIDDSDNKSLLKEDKDNSENDKSNEDDDDKNNSNYKNNDNKNDDDDNNNVNESNRNNNENDNDNEINRDSQNEVNENDATIQ